MGAPISGEDTQAWRECVSVVSGRVINCYTEKDWVLGTTLLVLFADIVRLIACYIQRLSIAFIHWIPK